MNKDTGMLLVASGDVARSCVQRDSYQAFFLPLQLPKFMWVDNSRTVAAQLYDVIPSLSKVLEDATHDMRRVFEIIPDAHSLKGGDLFSAFYVMFWKFSRRTNDHYNLLVLPLDDTTFGVEASFLRDLRCIIQHHLCLIVPSQIALEDVSFQSSARRQMLVI